MAKRPWFPEDMTILNQSQCWDLMRSVEVGRLALLHAGQIELFPINFVVDHGTIVFRTGEGTKLAAAVEASPVAFEVDGYDPDQGQAWSVVVKGQAHDIKVLYDMVDTFGLPLWPWHAKAKNRFVRIVPEEITGRRFQVVDQRRWHSPLTGVRPAPPE